MLTKSLFCRNYANAHFLFFQKAPIHYAVENGGANIVKILAENSADLNLKDVSEVRNYWKNLER